MTWHFLQCAEGGRLWSYNPHLIYIIQQAGGLLLLLNRGTLPSSGDVSGLKENPHHPATGGPWAQWENEDLCAPLNPQEFLIKQGSRAAEGPHPPPARGLLLWQGEWSSPLHFVPAAGYQRLLFSLSFLSSTRAFSQSCFQSPQDFLFLSFTFYISVCVCVCVCVRERERERCLIRPKERKGVIEFDFFLMVSWDIFVWRRQSTEL